jgi:uncharacterized protein (DUF885 family)
LRTFARHATFAALIVSVGAAASSGADGARRSAAPRRDASAYVPAPADITQPSELAELIERYQTDRSALLRLWSVPGTAARRERMTGFYRAWQARLGQTPFDALATGGKVDYVLLSRRLAYERQLLEREAAQAREMAGLLPFDERLASLPQSRRMLESVEPRAAADTLDAIVRDIEALQKSLRPAAKGRAADAAAAPEGAKPTKVVAARAAERIAELKRALDDWFKHYDGYDPVFSWWVRDPHRRVAKALEDYRKLLREEIVGVKAGEDDPIVGDPLGRDALLADIEQELIPYTPEELVGIAEREFAWCEREMKKASRDMGFGDDWKKALEKVKTQYVEPGRQPALVRELALEAIEFVTKHDLVTVPALAADMWRMEMMAPERQKLAPFFLGGEVIQVSFPTDTMEHEDKLNSLRANNRPFSRAVVHHELIPGHHLQGFMTQRYNPHRRSFQTPFWGEGWALYWEFVLWHKGFPQTPEDRVGMLFWRMHRCARIIFSLSFHLGKMTPQQCIDFLVERVGHERWTATGEVRRSFGGQYSPLYQAAYMLGGLQIRELRRELVESGKLREKDFHDRVLREGPISIELVRALLLDQPPAREFRSRWKFAGNP